ncbi:HRDC domain-containing protein [Sutcliffiella horikoshii]|uniref:Helicase n=1 Tax=Sutcliffiella horikoshii TaxID=79883 RepID=A0A5D4T8Y4_9BACI|nr:HRDC domain-containing protein [Sutcliffiella horikoshii]TYS71739.1 helicase [Sutcliffiella horikoshii]
MSFFKNVIDAFKDNREINQPIVHKDISENPILLENLKSLAESSNPSVDLKKVENHLKLFSIGHAGEKSVMFELKNSMVPMLILHDIYLEYEDYQAQMDFVLVTPKFILVLEVKKLFGDILVTDKGDFQRVIRKGNRVVNKDGMYSPINQVERHVMILERFLKAKEIIKKCPIRYAVTFANPKTILEISKNAPTHIQNCVIRHDQISAFLKAEMKKSSPVEMHASQVYKIADGILSASKEKPFNEREYLLEEEQVGASAFVAATVEKETPAVPIADNDIKQLLMEYRTKKAKLLEVKPYHIFSNRTLEILLEKMPQTVEQLLEVEGIGQKKAEEYGQDILSILQTKEVERFQESPKVFTPVKVQNEDFRSLLVEYRRTRARELNVKPYYIYTNKTLEVLLEQQPKTMKALMAIEGIGKKKADEFGEGIISIFNNHS